MKKLNVKNLKIYAGGILLGMALAASNSIDAYAEEEEVLYEETNNDYTTEPITETPPATNYEAEQPPVEETPVVDPAANNGDCIDKDNYQLQPGEGAEIPDWVPTEAERKGITPTPTPEPTPTPQPTPTPNPEPTPTPTPSNPNTPTPVNVFIPTATVEQNAPKTGDNRAAKLIFQIIGGSLAGATVVTAGSIVGKRFNIEEVELDEDIKTL